MRIQTQLRMENKKLRAQIKTDRFGMCPQGYTKIRDYCKGILIKRLIIKIQM